MLGHRGTTSFYDTISRRFYAVGLQRKIKALNCAVCQINKPANIQYGHLPARHASLEPWFAVAVDLIGPWKIEIHGRISIEIRNNQRRKAP